MLTGRKTSMEFSIRGIGIVKEADIKIDGLTVIAGSNNSGKTTVGRALYSIVSATGNLEENQNMDRAVAIVQRIWKILRPVSNWLNVYQSNTREYGEKIEFLDELIESRYGINGERLGFYTDLLFKLCESIEDESFHTILLSGIQRSFGKLFTSEDFASDWKNNREIMQNECKYAREFIAELQKQKRKEFAYKMIERTLQVEFSDQIQSFSDVNRGSASKIKLENAGMPVYEIYLSGNRVMTDMSQFSNIFFDRAYFVDDPYVMEDPLPSKPLLSPREDSYVVVEIVDHRRKMRQLMKKTQFEIAVSKTLSETIYREREIEEILVKINRIVPGKVSRNIYQEDGMKVKVGNLATGSKIFSIIKNILTDGDITDKTLLILDEPESHLHPKWINQLAEIIVLLVKECNITVLLTTHSPNFLLAIDALMRKYEIREKCHFYQTEREEDNRIKYVEKTDCLDNVYADFAASFAEMNALRKKYMTSEE